MTLRARLLDEPRKEEEKEMTTTQYVPTRTDMTAFDFPYFVNTRIMAP